VPSSLSRTRYPIRQVHHNNFFRTDAGIDYIEQVNSEYRLLFNAYDGTISYGVRKRFYESVDRTIVNTLNPALMEVLPSLEESIGLVTRISGL